MCDGIGEGAGGLGNSRVLCAGLGRARVEFGGAIRC